MDLQTLKSSKEMLLQALGIPEAKPSMLCPFHKEKQPSFGVFLGPSGDWRFKCFSCSVSGSVIDAVMLKKDMTATQALKDIEDSLGLRIDRNEDLQKPVIDHQKAMKYVDDAHRTLMNSFEIQEKLAAKRGITNLEVIEKYKVGYVQNGTFAGWKPIKYGGWSLNAWIFAVKDQYGELVGVKYHYEGRRRREQPKAGWCPFGTGKADRAKGIKVKHGSAAFFPCPEDFFKDDKPKILYLLAGELKALFMISKGRAAISPTTGESGMKPWLIDRLVAIVNKHECKLILIYDNDKAGHKWREFMLDMLHKGGVEATALTPYEMERLDTHIDPPEPPTTPLNSPPLGDMGETPHEPSASPQERSDRSEGAEAAVAPDTKAPRGGQPVIHSAPPAPPAPPQAPIITTPQIREWIGRALHNAGACFLCKWISEYSDGSGELRSPPTNLELLDTKGDFAIEAQLKHLQSEFGE